MENFPHNLFHYVMFNIMWSEIHIEQCIDFIVFIFANILANQKIREEVIVSSF